MHNIPTQKTMEQVAFDSLENIKLEIFVLVELNRIKALYELGEITKKEFVDYLNTLQPPQEESEQKSDDN